MVRKGKLVGWGSSEYPDCVKLISVGLGDIMCWKDGTQERVCSNDCAAWKYSDLQKIQCLALPHCSDIADIS